MIQWYPGHMKKTKDLIQSHLKQVDLVVEMLDTRIPKSSRNPVFDEMLRQKKALLLFNKWDLADESVTKLWYKEFESKEEEVLLFNAKDGSTEELLKVFAKHHQILGQASMKKGQKPRALRVMVIGVPNVGKSSLINRLAGRRGARVENRPGVTRGKQWIRIGSTIELFDTPGILWPKIDSQQQARKLAMVGSIRDEILPLEDIAYHLLDYLKTEYPQMILDRYQVMAEDTLELMDKIAIRRGCLLKKGEIDYERVTRILLDEFRSGQIGRISLEKPSDF